LALKLNLTFEYLLAIALSGLAVALYLIAWVKSANRLILLTVALFSSLLGAFLIPFGFWGG